jgi:hypothetical protein
LCISTAELYPCKISTVIQNTIHINVYFIEVQSISKWSLQVRKSLCIQVGLELAISWASARLLPLGQVMCHLVCCCQTELFCCCYRQLWTFAQCLFIYLFVCFSLVFWGRVSRCSPVYPGTHSLDQAALKLRNLPASASQVLGLKVCTIMPGKSVFIVHQKNVFVWIPDQNFQSLNFDELQGEIVHPYVAVAFLLGSLSILGLNFFSNRFTWMEDMKKNVSWFSGTKLMLNCSIMEGL